jgi:hypothetical protein
MTAPRERITSIAPMPGPLRTAVLGAVAATVIAGCGSDEGTIPPDNATAMLNRLEAVQSNVDAGDCVNAQAQADEFKSDVNLLPAEVDDEVKKGLQQSADQLENLASSQCEPDSGATGASGPTETTDSETSTPTATATTTTETTTEPPPEEPAEPQTQEPEQDQDLAPDGGQGQGGGNVGSDGGVSPSSGGVGSGGGG